MKQKNLPDDIESKSLDELKEILNNLVEKIEKNKASNQSEEDYLEIFKLNIFNKRSRGILILPIFLRISLK